MAIASLSSLAVLLCPMFLRQALQHCTLHAPVQEWQTCVILCSASCSECIPNIYIASLCMSPPVARTMHSYELPIGLWHPQLLGMQGISPIGEKCLCQILYLRTPEQQIVRFSVEIFQAASVLMSSPCLNVTPYIAGLQLLIKG